MRAKDVSWFEKKMQATQFSFSSSTASFPDAGFPLCMHSRDLIWFDQDDAVFNQNQDVGIVHRGDTRKRCLVIWEKDASDTNLDDAVFNQDQDVWIVEPSWF